MRRALPRIAPLFLVLAAFPGCDSREKEMARQMDLEKGEKKAVEVKAEEVPPYPTRGKLMPVLEKIYPLQTVPPVLESEEVTDDVNNYEVQAGVAAVVKLRVGL